MCIYLYVFLSEWYHNIHNLREFAYFYVLTNTLGMSVIATFILSFVVAGLIYNVIGVPSFIYSLMVEFTFFSIFLATV